MRQAHRVLEPVRRAWRDKLQRAVEEVVSKVVTREVDRAVDKVVTAIRDTETRSRRDLWAAGERDAVLASARVVRTAMRSAKMLPDPVATLEYALTLAPADGMALEFGVFSGRTLGVIARARRSREVYGFDSFEGLPENWRVGFPAGTFGGDMLPAGVPRVRGAELVPGWFDETLPRFLEEHPGPVAFLHIDADLYSSARTVLELVGPRLHTGSVIVFDEFFNYQGWEDGEFRAWEEYVKTTEWQYCYEAFTVDNEQVAIRLTDTGDTDDPDDGYYDHGRLDGQVEDDPAHYSFPGQPVS